MKRIAMFGTAVLSLTLGIAASAYAQQEQRDQQEEQKGKSAQQEEKKTQPEKSAKPVEKKAENQSKNARQEEKPSQPQDKNTKNEDKNAQQHTQPAPSGKREQPAGGNRGGRIPAERFRANFGQEHRFHVSQADYGRDRRFQYGGYWFGFVDPWPGNWLYTQDVYVVEINGMYYLCNPSFPGVNILLSVTP